MVDYIQYLEKSRLKPSKYEKQGEPEESEEPHGRQGRVELEHHAGGVVALGVGDVLLRVRTAEHGEELTISNSVIAGGMGRW